MAQHDYIISNATFPAVRTDINNALSAIQTTNSGTSRPTGAVAGQLWLDTTSATTPTLKYYDGADDISLATIDHVGNTVNWLDSTVSITGLSTTATGTVLTLSDSINTTTVNLIIDNQKEIRFRETTANGTNYVALKAPASVASDLTFTLPATDGASGQALVTNGSGVLSFASAGTSWQSVKTSGFTAVAGEGYPCNTTSSAFTVTLPASPSVGSYVQIVDYAGTFATNNITLGANSNKINGVVANKVLTTNREAVTLVYVDSTQGWVSTSASNYGTISLDPTTYAIDFLVIAGGGSGGKQIGGGGGAGGFRTSTQTVSVGTVITVTVGDGGSAVSGTTSDANSYGNSGSNSSISGSGLTTITSAGGGGGAGLTSPRDGLSGGSGGGGCTETGIGGAGNTPSTSPSQGNTGGNSFAGGGINSTSGGGGGAGGVGGNASSNVGGNGGNGTASSITGSSVTYAGGGGGSRHSGSGTAKSSGGTGGGGEGGYSVASVTAGSGTVNTGSGGGGNGYYTPNASPSGAGGKGVVILSMPDASYSGTTTGSPTVTPNAYSTGKTVIQFNGSGSYTT
jgi:hypothetical protein